MWIASATDTPTRMDGRALVMTKYGTPAAAIRPTALTTEAMTTTSDSPTAATVLKVR